MKVKGTIKGWMPVMGRSMASQEPFTAYIDLEIECPPAALPAVHPPSVFNASNPSGPDSSTRPVPPSCFHPEIINSTCTVCGEDGFEFDDDLFAVWGPV